MSQSFCSFFVLNPVCYSLQDCNRWNICLSEHWSNESEISGTDKRGGYNFQSKIKKNNNNTARNTDTAQLKPNTFLCGPLEWPYHSKKYLHKIWHTNIHSYRHNHTSSLGHKHTHTHPHTPRHTLTYTYTLHTHTPHTHTPTHRHPAPHTHSHIYTPSPSTHTHTRTNTHTPTHPHTHTPTHTHTHTVLKHLPVHRAVSR